MRAISRLIDALFEPNDDAPPLEREPRAGVGIMGGSPSYVMVVFGLAVITSDEVIGEACLSGGGHFMVLSAVGAETEYLSGEELLDALCDPLVTNATA